MPGIGSSAFGQWGIGGEPTPLTNPLLDRPSVVWCVDLYLESSFPITFPWQFSAEPVRVSTLDLYPGGVLGEVLYEARLVEKPTLIRQTADVFGGLEESDTLRLKMVAAPSVGGANLHQWVAGEHRGKLVVAHLVELDPTTFATVSIAENVFRGEIVAMADDPSTVDILVRAFDLASFTDIVPVVRVTPDWAPYAPVGSTGRVVPHGIGIGRRIPCVPIKVRSADDARFSATFTADAGTDALTITDHGRDTGDGPMQVTSTGTLPGGLSTGVDYWVVVVDENTLRLAETRGNATANVVVDITSAGSGTQTLSMGLAPNLEDHYDLATGIGNVGIVRVWQDETADGSGTSTPPEFPVTYQVLQRAYRPAGRYLTALRFIGDLTGTEITADVRRVYPDVDDGVVAEYKWLRGFQDDVAGRDAVTTVDSAATNQVTTANLVQDEHRYGLGAVRLDGTRYFDLPNPEVFALQEQTIEVRFTPSFAATGARNALYTSPLSWGDEGVSLGYDGENEAVYVYVWFYQTEFGIGVPWLGYSTAGVAPRGEPLWLVFRRTLTGADLILNGTVVDSTTNTTAIQYRGTGTAKLGGVGATAGAVGDLGYVRISAVARTDAELEAARRRWARNGIEWCRELVISTGRAINMASFNQAATAWDAVESGSLKCDGWLVEENELRTVLEALVPFRDLRFQIGMDRELSVMVATAPTAIQATFGHGDQFGNLLELPTRLKASLTEAVRELVVRFRRPRNGSGAFAGYAQEVRRPVFAVGQREVVLEAPFVDDAVTADVIADWRAKRMRTRDQVVDLVVGHEGRNLAPGDVVRLHVPSMGIEVLDLEVAQLSKGADQARLRTVPIAIGDFTYTPKPLPPDPLNRTLIVLDLGNAPALTATLSSGRVVLTPALRDTTSLRPRANGALTMFPTLVGAATHWEAVGEASPDDATTYVRGTYGIELYTLTALQSSLSRIESVDLRVRMQSQTGTVSVYPVLQYGPEGQRVALTTAWSVTSSFAEYASVLTVRPTAPAGTGEPWTVADLQTLQAGVYVFGDTHVTQVYAVVTQVRETPPAAGYVRYWRVGPSASQPATPAETDPVFLTALDLAPQIVDVSGTSGQKFWYFARLYNELGQAILTLGVSPAASVTIP